jgi:hypothetical protein
MAPWRSREARVLVHGSPCGASTSSGVVSIDQQANQTSAELPLRRRFATRTGGTVDGPHVWAGVTETNEDAPTIGIVIPRDRPNTTRESAILSGERDIDFAADV